MVILTFMVYLLFRLNPAGLTCFKKTTTKAVITQLQKHQKQILSRIQNVT